VLGYAGQLELNLIMTAKESDDRVSYEGEKGEEGEK
jgi:hypothetical protein